MRQRRTVPIVDRFWECANKTENGCWLWAGTRNKYGYGRISVGGGRGENYQVMAHRLSWEMRNGPIPDGHVICHRCDNPPCVNPDHLFLGTHAVNMTDKADKGRAPRGEQHWNGKLTKAAVRAIRVASAAGATRKSLAEIHAVGEGAIQSVTDGSTWKHVTDGDGLQPAIDRSSRSRMTHRGSNHTGSKLDEVKVVEIRRRYASGEHASALAVEYGVSGPLISAIVTGRNWRHVQDGLQPLIDARPRPLRLGTGQRPGSGHPFAKLDEEKVVEIRRRVAAGERQSDLAAEFGVSRPTLCSIVARTTWRHVE